MPVECAADASRAQRGSSRPPALVFDETQPFPGARGRDLLPPVFPKTSSLARCASKLAGDGPGVQPIFQLLFPPGRQSHVRRGGGQTGHPSQACGPHPCPPVAPAWPRPRRLADSEQEGGAADARQGSVRTKFSQFRPNPAKPGGNRVPFCRLSAGIGQARPRRGRQGSGGHGRSPAGP
jgi:hypothetical protein